MARVRIEDTALHSWDDVDVCLADIGECQRGIEAVEAKMQEAIDSAKLAAGMEAAPYQERIKRLELDIKRFVDAHSTDLDGKKTKQLTFGQTGYRRSTKVMLPKAAAKIGEIVRNLRAKGMDNCIVPQPEKVNREALKKYTPEQIREVGAGIVVKDTFWYEVDREKLDRRASK